MKTKIAHGRSKTKANKAQRRRDRRRQRNHRVAAARRRLESRLEEAAPKPDSGRPVMGTGKVDYEFAERTQATAHGGIVMAHSVAVLSGLVSAIDKRRSALVLAGSGDRVHIYDGGHRRRRNQVECQASGARAGRDRRLPARQPSNAPSAAVTQSGSAQRQSAGAPPPAETDLPTPAAPRR